MVKLKSFVVLQDYQSDSSDLVSVFFFIWGDSVSLKFVFQAAV